MSKKLDKTLILNRIKAHYGFKRNTELAKFLGISNTTLSNWYVRNTMDFDLIFTKCEELNPNWIITGEGKQSKLYPTQEDTEPSVIEDILDRYIGPSAKATNKEEDTALLYKIIAIQETTIKAQEKTIEAIEQQKRRK